MLIAAWGARTSAVGTLPRRTAAGGIAAQVDRFWSTPVSALAQPLLGPRVPLALMLSLSGGAAHAVLGGPSVAIPCDLADAVAPRSVTAAEPHERDTEAAVDLFDFDVDRALHVVDDPGLLFRGAALAPYSFGIAGARIAPTAVWRYTPDPDDAFVAPFNVEAWADAATFRSCALTRACVGTGVDSQNVRMPDGASAAMSSPLPLAVSIGLTVFVLFGLFRSLISA